MKDQNRIKLALTIVLVLGMLVPTVSARRKTLVKIRTIPGDNFVQYDDSEYMPNGFTNVDVCYNFSWYDYDWNYLGYALQYITGITKTGSGNDFSSLHGYGVFYSEVDGKPGTITYKIGNIFKPPSEFWGGHLKVCEGTEYFEGLKGQGLLNFDEFVFELFLDYNPWE